METKEQKIKKLKKEIEIIEKQITDLAIEGESILYTIKAFERILKKLEQELKELEQCK